MNAITLDLPWPPSANTYYRRSGRKIHISDRGKQFLQEVGAALHGQWRCAPIDELVIVYIELWAPNARSWDVDNRIKPTLDAIAKAGVLTNDKIVRKVTAEDMGIRRPHGEMLVHISPFTDERDGLE